MFDIMEELSAKYFIMLGQVLSCRCFQSILGIEQNVKDFAIVVLARKRRIGAIWSLRMAQMFAIRNINFSKNPPHHLCRSPSYAVRNLSEIRGTWQATLDAFRVFASADYNYDFAPPTQAFWSIPDTFILADIFLLLFFLLCVTYFIPLRRVHLLVLDLRRHSGYVQERLQQQHFNMPEIDPHISEYSHHKHRPREKEALHSLKKIASLVKPIMRARGWRVGTLAEFYPEQRNLLGVSSQYLELEKQII